MTAVPEHIDPQPAGSGAADRTPDAEAAADAWFAGKKIFWLPIAPLVALDLWSKAAAFAHVSAENGYFSTGNKVEVFDSAWIDFHLVTYLNLGTIMGMGQEFHGALKVVRVIAIGVILWFVYKTPAKARFGLLSLGLIMAGALGNLYDNMIHVGQGWPPKLAGAVRDFLYFSNEASPRWQFPAFNVADSCITVGATMLFIVLWFTPDPAKAQGSGAADS